MIRPSIKGQRLAALFLLGFLLFNYPLLDLFSGPTRLLGIPVLYAYIVPAVGTNVFRIWEFNTRLRLGRFRPHHGFVFGSASVERFAQVLAKMAGAMVATAARAMIWVRDTSAPAHRSIACAFRDQCRITSAPRAKFRTGSVFGSTAVRRT